MATIAIMIGGAMLNATTFIGGNYLARALGGGHDAALDKKMRHDKALEAYQAACNKYSRERSQLLDWIETNAEVVAKTKQIFTNTDYAFKLYNQAHPDKLVAPLKGPKFSNFYQPSKLQKKKASWFFWAQILQLWPTPRFVSLEHRRAYCDGYQASQDILQSRRLLERPRRYQKVG